MNVRTSKKLMLAAAVVCMINFTSCKKYADGPLLSLKTKTARLTGEWDVKEVDGKDLETYMFGDDAEGVSAEIILEFEKGGDMKVTVDISYDDYEYSESFKGDWEWSDDKESIEVDVEDMGWDKEEMEILRLTNKELWAEDEDGDEWQAEKL